MLNFLPVALAFAEGEAAQSSTGSSLLSMAPLAILFVIFYFLLIRPQQKRAKEHKAMLTKIEKGDNVVTSAGIHGRVYAVNEDTIMVEVADNVRIKVSKDAIAVRKPQG